MFDQKYEMIADISANTRNFADDKKNIMELIEKSNAVIQMESSSMVSELRTLNLTIGVHPANFDVFIEELEGKISIIKMDIEKRDKTSEYKNLKAGKLSLEKTRDALIALKSRPGKIEEMVELEYKILEFEKQIKDYGVSLGEFDVENEFCTVQLKLYEEIDADAFLFFRKLLDSFLWAAGSYALIVLIIFLAGLGTLIILVVSEKVRKFYLDMVKNRKL
ncbi:MAG: DUF4349 domain-containing protein [Spirochaetales bacterium]|nr:DUF4349 domain-containing protein [Spirochaetales bacterium]